MKHGHAKRDAYSAEYRAWYTMKNRCMSPTAQNWKEYGGRGITVCDRWMKFESFLADMGRRPRGMTLDRIDNSKGYGPDNCRWASMREQARNRSSTNLLTFEGRTMCVTDWAAHLGVAPSTLRKRLSKMSIQEALTKPIDTGKRHP